MEIKSINNKSEISKVLDLYIKVFAESPYNEIWSRESAYEDLAESFESGREYCLYAEEKGSIVGLVFCRQHTGYDGFHLIIEDMAIDKKYRSRGVGTAMIKRLEELAREKHIASIDLLANIQAKASDFWKKLGYKPNGYIKLTKKILPLG